MTMKGYWMIRTIRSGMTVEKTQFWVGEKRPRSPRRKGATTQAKAERNLTGAVRRLARILNCNFREGDLFVTLTYDHEPQSIEEADKACALFWRRMSRALGERLKGVWITADKDEDSGVSVRLHHHAVISGAGIEVKDGSQAEACIGGRALSDIWGHGYVDVRPLNAGQQDFTPVAAYLVRQAAGCAGQQKWHSSRGLEKPVIVDEQITYDPRELRAPSGADVKEISHYDEQTGSHYIRYIYTPKPRRKKGGPVRHETKQEARQRRKQT